MSRRLFVYYKLPESRWTAILPALEQLQARCRTAMPGLQAELMRRPGSSDGTITVMETYAAQAGLDDAQQRRIESAFVGLFNELALPVQRHTEVFETLD